MSWNFTLFKPLHLEEAILSTPEKIILASLMVFSVALFFVFLSLKLKRVSVGMADNRLTNIGARFWRLIRDVLFQFQVIRSSALGIAHAAIVWGFLVFMIEKAYHFPKAFGFSIDSVDSFYNAVLGKVFFFFSIFVLLGILFLSVRRAIVKPKRLEYTADPWIVLGLITIIMLTFLVPFFTNSEIAVKIASWGQNITILFFLVYIPLSKHLHLLFCPFNEFFKNFELAKLRLLDLEDEEKEDYGVNTLKDLSWKDLFDTYTCVHCGICVANCPAANTNKELSPRSLILNLQESLHAKKFDEPIIGETVENKAIWECTTCGACEYLCPVGIEHLPKLIGLRRYQAQVEDNFPKEAQTTFQALEKTGNPWSYAPSAREETISEVDVPLFEEGTEYLLWFGCFANYDAGYRKTVKAFIDILKKASVSFGVLSEETCCGDPARKLGNEFVFQALAEGNKEMFEELGVTKIITACPHCLKTLASDYKDMGITLDVTHHTDFIATLIKEGKISVKENAKKVVYHDPCYMSRYQESTQSARYILSKTGAELVEPSRSKDHSFCCGGGGGAIFLEEEGDRINHNRIDELLKTQAEEVCIACPICNTMLKDAVADRGKADSVSVVDVAQIVADNLL